MENLVQLVASLKKSEVQFIQHYYKQDTDKKRLQFFNAVLSGEIKTDEAAAKKFYGKKGAAYSQLKSRLTKDLMNLLLFEEGSKQSESELFQNEVEVLRKYLQGKILLVRKVQGLALKLLYESSDLSKKYNLLLEKILADKLLSIREGNRLGVEKYNQILKETDNEIEQLSLIHASEKLYYSIALPNAVFKNNENEFKKVSLESMNELNKIYSVCNIPSIGYYFYLTAINYFTIVKDFSNLYKFSQEFLQLLRKHNSIGSNSRIVNAIMQFFTACMYLGEYEIAYTQANDALKLTIKNGVNEFIVIEYLFLAQLRLNGLKVIEELLLLAKNHPRMSNSDFNIGKWTYYQAVYYFLNKDFMNSLRELQKENALLKDKSGWLFGHKLLEIMCYIELGEFDMIEFRVEALRKLLQRQKDKNIIRMKTIFSILGTFIKTGASFKNTLALESDKLALLQEGKDEHYWDPLGFEIIRFDTWFAAKANN